MVSPKVFVNRLEIGGGCRSWEVGGEGGSCCCWLVITCIIPLTIAPDTAFQAPLQDDVLFGCRLYIYRSLDIRLVFPRRTHGWTEPSTSFPFLMLPPCAADSHCIVMLGPCE